MAHHTATAAHYLVSEEEFNSLDALRSELSMVSALLIHHHNGANEFDDPKGMGNFLERHMETLKALVRAMEARHEEHAKAASAEAARPDDCSISGGDFTTIFQVLSGLASVTRGHVKELSRKLHAFSQQDAALAPMFAAWMMAVTPDDQGTDFMHRQDPDDEELMQFAKTQPIKARRAAHPIGRGAAKRKHLTAAGAR